ncbi:MAG TPA: alpha/beta fold hydrolase [Candidatus Binatia bacterium]|nr:alpha/beta fold hydrolase [Candidatus Binatia bacterium]
MAAAVTMPRLGLAMVEGTVVEWRARPGDRVSRGATLLTVQSEKAEVEVEASASGVLAAVYVEPGRAMPVGALLGAIAAPGEPFDAAAFAATFVPTVEPPTAPAAAAPPGARAPAVGVTRPVAPAARALARRLGIDPAGVPGTGPGGRVTVEDVERAAAGAGGVSGGGLEFAVTGDGPTLLLLNGWGVDASAWQPQTDALRDAFTVISYEHRGVGGSPPIAGAAATVAGLADDAHALLAHLGRAPAVLAGASLGAAVALEVALRHPGAVRALALLSPPFLPDARLAAVLAAWRDAGDPTADARVRALLPWLFGRDFLAHDGRREGAVRAWRTMAARTPADALRHHAEALRAWLGTRAGTPLAIEVPAVIAAGDDDVLTPPHHARALAAALRARLEILPGAGHALGLERPAAVVDLVRDLGR